MLTHMRSLLVALAAVFTLTACGYRTPLTLPQPKPQPQTEPQAKPPVSAPVEREAK
jgi:predicted small lipoprotein YifL